MRIPPSKRQSHGLPSKFFHYSCSCLLLPLLATTFAAAPSLSAFSSVLASFLLAIWSKSIATAQCEGCGCEPVGQIDLCADSVGEVGYDKDILDMCVAGALLAETRLKRGEYVQVALNVGGVDFGCQTESVHQKLS